MLGIEPGTTVFDIDARRTVIAASDLAPGRGTLDIGVIDVAPSRTAFDFAMGRSAVDIVDFGVDTR